MAAHNDLGHWGEAVAASYLQHHDHRIVARNWQYGHRDIDIIAYDEEEDCVAFVEVKTRRNNLFAEPTQAVNHRKIRSISAAAQVYLRSQHITANLRFDIITVVGTDSDNCRIEHIKNAFLPLP